MAKKTKRGLRILLSVLLLVLLIGVARYITANSGIGTSSPDTELEISKDSASTTFTISAYHDTEATSPTLTLRKADNTEASPAPVDDGAYLGTINFNGYDDNGWDIGAQIRAQADAGWGASERGTELFLATRDGAGVLTDQYTVTADGHFRALASEWYKTEHFVALNTASGASGATLVLPGANSLGGYNLDDDTEYLYITAHVHEDWDAASDLILELVFEVDVNNGTGGTGDDVVFDTLCYYKGNGDTVNRTQTPTGSVEIGQSARYKLFPVQVAIVYNAGGGNALAAGDVISIRINFDETSSDITDVVLVHLTLKYQTLYLNEEI